MNLNYRKLLLVLALFSTLIIQSCDDDEPEQIETGEEGFFVVNEGGFPNDNTSISFFDREKGEMTNDIFFSVNAKKLGIQAQSLSVFEDKAYIVVQGSKKIEVIDADDYTTIATIKDGVPSPRYFLAVSTSKAYVSDWGEDGNTGTVKVIDLGTNAVTKTIPTGKGTNKMIKVGNVVYVTNAGGQGSDNTVKLIDTSTDEVTSSISVGDNPNSILQDAAGNIWVSCSGAIVYNEDWSIDQENSTKGSISKIANNVEAMRFDVETAVYGGAGNLAISPDGKTLYYTYYVDHYTSDFHNTIDNKRVLWF
jgi:YVTN family beta-propeller protein